MADTSGCKNRCWTAGAVAGLVVAAWLLLVSHLGFFPAIFLGLVTFALFGGFLVWAFCPEQGVGLTDKDYSAKPQAAPAASVAASAASANVAASSNAAPAAQPAAASAAPVAAAATAAPATSAPAAAAPAASAQPAALMSAPAAAPAEKAPVASAAEKPAKAEKPAAAAKAEKPAKAAKAEAEKPAAEKPAKAAKSEAKPEDDPKVAADIAAVEAAGAGTQPAALAAPRGEKDDLEVIEGIGPVLHAKCNELGIFHFDQIAAWGPAEVAWMEGNIKRLKGRVTRDKWVAQAKIIVAEGVDAFLIRAKTNNY